MTLALAPFLETRGSCAQSDSQRRRPRRDHVQYVCQFSRFCDTQSSAPSRRIENSRFVDPNAPFGFHDQFTKRGLDPQ